MFSEPWNTRTFAVHMTTTRVKYETDVDKIIWSKVYSDQQYRWFLSTGLMAYGIREFRRATIIMKLAELEREIQKRVEGDETNGDFFHQFLLDQLVDDFRICTYFENHMKAQLLFRGAIIHTFQKVGDDDTKRKALDKDQKNGPIRVDRILSGELTDADLSQKTIGVRQMLKESYNAAIGLPNDVRDIIRKIVDRRDKLHLKLKTGFHMNSDIAKEYRRLVEFADVWDEKIVKAFKAEPTIVDLTSTQTKS